MKKTPSLGRFTFKLFKEMINIKPFLRIYNNDSDTAIVWVRFYIQSKKIQFTTKVRCRIADWDESETRIKSSDKNFRDKNTVIQSVISRVHDVFVKFRLKDKKMTVDSFTRAYNRPSDYETFFAFYSDYEKKYSYQLERSTWETHKVAMGKMAEFNSDLHFDDIDSDWLDLYYSHLRKDLKNNENTAYKNMSVIRKYVNAAYRAGYLDENPFQNWKIKRGKASYMYLKEEELVKFIKYYQSGECPAKHYSTLEFFLFMCFSSLHVSDAKSLKLEQFYTDSFTYYRIKNRNSKPEPINIPISEALRKLVDNIVRYRKKGLIFENLPADQTMNKYLKAIGKHLEIENANSLSHKAGRHTFATFYLSKTKDLASLKEILGHSELRETLIYAHVLDESKQEGIKFFNEFEL